MTPREMMREALANLHRLPGVTIRTTDTHRARTVANEVAKEMGLSISVFASKSPMELYVVNKEHPAVASVYRGGGLPPAKALRLQQQRNGEDSESPNQGLHAAPQKPDNPSGDS